MNMSEDNVTDVEIEADICRLATSGNYHNLPSMLAEVRKMYPNETRERIDRCAKMFAARLWEADYGEYRSEYVRLGMNKKNNQTDPLE